MCIYENDLYGIDKENCLGVFTGNQQIARYLTSKKYKDVFENKRLYFSNVKCFDDNSERTLPEAFLKRLPSLEAREFYSKVNKLKNNSFQSYVSCWTKFENENLDFWQKYVGNDSGILIICDYKSLEVSLNSNNYVALDISYIDLLDKSENLDLPWVLFADNKNVRASEKFKSKKYDWEKELRLVAYSMNDSNGAYISFKDFNWIKKIVISPYLSNEQKKNIKMYLSKYIPKEIIFSSNIDLDYKV